MFDELDFKQVISNYFKYLQSDIYVIWMMIPQILIGTGK